MTAVWLVVQVFKLANPICLPSPVGTTIVSVLSGPDRLK